jgi:two-component system chemotaxis response regulator CheB
MNQSLIKVLVVDDSPVIRELIREAISRHADLQVVGVASDGEQALRAMRRLEPDIVTLDLQMPRMDGLTTLDKILEHYATPVIVVSSLTQRAADITMQALQRGAMDYVAKPEGLHAAAKVFGEELPNKLRNMAGTDVRRVLRYRQSRDQRARMAPTKVDDAGAQALQHGCIAIGVSTGGPPALTAIFGALLPPLPPIVIVQHMPPLFTGPFANRLNALSCLTVREAQEGDLLRPNVALLAPGGRHLAVRRVGHQVRVTLSDSELVSGHRPSADVMMHSVAGAFGARALGVIMTGMGRDGSNGCAAIRAAGGFVLGQNEMTSDVYGMNKVAFVEGNVDAQVALDELADAMSSHGRRLARAGAGAKSVSPKVSL